MALLFCKSGSFRLLALEALLYLSDYTVYPQIIQVVSQIIVKQNKKAAPSKRRSSCVWAL